MFEREHLVRNGGFQAGGGRGGRARPATRRLECRPCVLVFGEADAGEAEPALKGEKRRAGSASPVSLAWNSNPTNWADLLQERVDSLYGLE